jgi:TonB family protein
VTLRRWSNAALLSLALHVPGLLLVDSWMKADPPPEQEPAEQPLALVFVDVAHPEPASRTEDAPELDPTADQADALEESATDALSELERESQGQDDAREADLEHQDAEDPEEAPVEEPDDEDDRLVHVRSDAQGGDDAPDDTTNISDRNLVVQRESRAAKPHLQWGDENPGKGGQAGVTGSVSPDTTLAPQNEAAREGLEAAEVLQHTNLTPQERKEAEAQRDEGESGGSAAEGPQAESDAAGGRTGDDATGAGQHRINPSSTGQPAQARAEQVESPPPAPEGWEPTVVRVDPSVGRTAPSTAEAQQERDQVDQAEEIELARAPEAAERKGSEGTERHSSPTPEQQQDDFAPAIADLEVEGDDTPKAERGWGGDQLAASTQTSVAGQLVQEGEVATTSATTVEEQVELLDQNAVSARKDDRAPYFRELETIVNANWLESTPVEYKAAGYQGTTQVVFVVDRRGRVISKEVVRQSGYRELDELALAAVPERFPKPPKGLAEPTVEYAINLRLNDHWGEVRN